jgi:hypothetical protein
MDDVRVVANRFVEKHFPFVCVIHGGMAVIRADYPDRLVKRVSDDAKGKKTIY